MLIQGSLIQHLPIETSLGVVGPCWYLIAQVFPTRPTRIATLQLFGRMQKKHAQQENWGTRSLPKQHIGLWVIVVPSPKEPSFNYSECSSAMFTQQLC
eukprot:5156456-Amphidinium_carterae.1